MEGIPWFVFPLILLTIGLIGLILTIRSFKSGGSISLKKLIAIVVLLCLGVGIFMQKAGIVDNSQLKNLLLAFDYEARNEADLKRQQEQVDKQNEINEKMKETARKSEEALEKVKRQNEALKKRNKN